MPRPEFYLRMKRPKRTGRRPATWNRWAAVAAAILGVSSCDLFTAPLPMGAEAMEPLPHYGRWWKMVEECSGISRRMGAIDWYQVPGGNFRSPSGGMANGLYLQGSERIVLAEAVVDDGPIVRHEMLHAIIRRNDSETPHPADYFLRRCSGVVDCRQGCIETAGPIDVPSAPTKPATVLQITLEVDSVVNREEFPDFVYVPVAVRARNPLDQAIRVELPPYAGLRSSFILDVEPPSGTFGVWDATAYARDPLAGYFDPGETKQYVFDLYLPKAAIGVWSARGSFANNWQSVRSSFRLK